MPQLLVFSNPSSPERDAEFNDWYGNVHLGEVLALPGFSSARRYRVSETQVMPLPGDFSQYRYVAIYEIDGDVATALKSLTEAGTDGTLHMSDVLSMDPLPITMAVEDA